MRTRATLNRRIGVIPCLTALAAALLLSACGKPAEPAKPAGDDGAAAPKPAAKSYLIGVVAKSDSNPVFQAARTGAEDAAAELSEKYGVKIEVSWQTPPSEDAQRQAQFVDQLVAAGADGITLSASDGNVAALHGERPRRRLHAAAGLVAQAAGGRRRDCLSSGQAR
jgi:ABC-type sugar transport system substrate-binding protein